MHLAPQQSQHRLVCSAAFSALISRRTRICPQASVNSGPQDIRRELSSAVRKQAARHLAQLREELIDPWFQPPPAPLTDTVPPSALADADSRFISVDGIWVHYKQIGGDVSAPAVLLLHGFNGSTFNWRDVMQGISKAGAGPEGRRIIAFDRPPFGLTERPLRWDGSAKPDPYTCEGGARLAAGLLDALGIESAVVVGHSMGAVVAMEMLKLHPEKVAALGFIAPALPARPDAFRRSMTAWQQLQALARLALLRNDRAGLNYIRKTLRARAAEVQAGHLQVHHDSSLVSQDVIEGYLLPMKADNWDMGSLLGFRSISFSQSLPAYGSVKQPVLIIQGLQDSAMLTSAAKQIADQLAQRQDCVTRYVELDACGHIPMEEYPDRFVQEVGEFLKAIEGGRAAPAASKRAAEQLTSVGDTLPAAAAGLSKVESA